MKRNHLKSVVLSGLVLLLLTALVGCDTADNIVTTETQPWTQWTPDLCETDGHTWVEATCGLPKYCSVCNKFEGTALGHEWTDSSCTVSKSCTVCGEVKLAAPGHTWTEATCTSPKTCSACGEVDGTALGHKHIGGTCTQCNDVLYSRINSEGVATADGNYILFGTYPQSAVADSTLIAALNGLTNELYPSGDKPSNLDIIHGEEKYRGVYSQNQYYWFKFEPIKWRILKEENGKAFIFCDMAIDVQAFDNSAFNRFGYMDIVYSELYVNDYNHSDIRKWLNETFYDTAFADLQKQLIQLTTTDELNDNVFLLSVNEVTSAEYGFSNDPSSRQQKATDYAKQLGIHVDDDTGAGSWWLRTPDSGLKYATRIVHTDGKAEYYGEVDESDKGVCPALWIAFPTE